MIDYPVYLRKQADWAEDELPNTAKTFRDAAAEFERLQQYPSVIASMKQGSFTDARVCEDIERRVKEEWRLAAPLDVCHRPEVCCDCEHETACDALCDHRRRREGDRADEAHEREDVPPEAERTMPVGPFLDSLNHSAACDCEWCKADEDRADKAQERKGE